VAQKKNGEELRGQGHYIQSLGFPRRKAKKCEKNLGGGWNPLKSSEQEESEWVYKEPGSWDDSTMPFATHCHVAWIPFTDCDWNRRVESWDLQPRPGGPGKTPSGCAPPAGGSRFKLS